jgi:hypothetical protein
VVLIRNCPPGTVSFGAVRAAGGELSRSRWGDDECPEVCGSEDPEDLSGSESEHPFGRAHPLRLPLRWCAIARKGRQLGVAIAFGLLLRVTGSAVASEPLEFTSPEATASCAATSGPPLMLSLAADGTAQLRLDGASQMLAVERLRLLLTDLQAGLADWAAERYVPDRRRRLVTGRPFRRSPYRQRASGPPRSPGSKDEKGRAIGPPETDRSDWSSVRYAGGPDTLLALIGLTEACEGGWCTWSSSRWIGVEAVEELRSCLAGFLGSGESEAMSTESGPFSALVPIEATTLATLPRGSVRVLIPAAGGFLVALNEEHAPTVRRLDASGVALGDPWPALDFTTHAPGAPLLAWMAESGAAAWSTFRLSRSGGGTSSSLGLVSSTGSEPGTWLASWTGDLLCAG